MQFLKHVKEWHHKLIKKIAKELDYTFILCKISLPVIAIDLSRVPNLEYQQTRMKFSREKKREKWRKIAQKSPG